MKVGDLVKLKKHSAQRVGLVIERGVYVGRKNIKVFWPNSDEPITMYTGLLEVVNDR